MLTLGSALERIAGQPLVYRALGQVWLDRAQAHNDGVYLSKALEALGRVASSPDATSEVLTLYGRALLLDGQLDAAEQGAAAGDTRYPLEPAVARGVRDGRRAPGSSGRRPPGAHRLRRAGRDDTDAVAHAGTMATLSVKLNDPPTAVSWLGDALRMAPDDVRVLAQLADAQMRAGDRAAAQDDDRARPREGSGQRALLALARRAR